jgi:phytoene desaturase
MSKSAKPACVVIGAGLGGLSAAISLACDGFRVTVVEQRDCPGGKMGEWRAGGYRFDTGPSVLTMRPVYETLFRSAGRDLNDYVSLSPVDPITRYFWRDGLVLDATTDADAMCEQIRRFSPPDVDGYRRYMRHVAGVYAAVREPFLFRPRPGVRDLLRLPISHALKIDALRTMHQAVRAHFRDPRLVQLFDRFATYNGSSPYQAPATLNVIAHVEMAQGAWYPRGGVYQLALAYERLAIEMGVVIQYGARVTEIATSASAVTGARLLDGTVLRAPVVVANADVSAVYANLLHDRSLAEKPAQRLRRMQPSCSGLIMMAGVTTQQPELAHHNIFFSDDYRAEFRDIFERGVPPGQPTIYACITSKTDSDHAPAGCENWFVLVNAPYLSNAFAWETESAGYLDTVQAILSAWPGHALLSPKAVAVRRVLTPLDLRDLYGTNAGSIYGLSSNTRMAAFARSSNRAPGIRGLYFANGSAHPGGGVPLVTLSGMFAARCVTEDA